MLDDDSLEQCGGHAGVPHALGVDDDDRTARAHAETGRLATLHATRPEEEPFALEQAREQRVERSSLAIRRAEAADAHEHVASVRLHERRELLRRESGHGAKSSAADASGAETASRRIGDAATDGSRRA